MSEPARPAGVPVTSVIEVLIYNLRLLLFLGGLGAVATKVLADRLGWPLASGIVGTLAVAGAVGYGWAYERMRIRERVVIRRAPEDLFRLLVDAYLQPPAQNRTAEPRLVTREQTSSGLPGVGTTWREVVEQGGRQAEWQYVITAYELNRKFAFQATSHGPPVPDAGAGAGRVAKATAGVLTPPPRLMPAGRACGAPKG